MKTTQKKSKKQKVHEEPQPDLREQDDDDESDEDDTDDVSVVDDEEQEEEECEEAADDETDEKRVRRVKAQRRNNRKNARQVGYRKWAKAAGLKTGSTASFGNDMSASVFTIADVTRMASWCPQTADTGIELQEFKKALEMRDASLPQSAAIVLQTNVESFARKVVADVVMRSFEAQGPATVTAANVRSVLRPFNAVLRSEFSTPFGLVRAAQHIERSDDKTIIPRTTDDDEKIAEERKFAKMNHSKLMRQADRDREEAREARKKRRTDVAQTATDK